MDERPFIRSAVWLFAYATYDLSNYATLRNWSLSLTLIDPSWGAPCGVGNLVAFLDHCHHWGGALKFCSASRYQKTHWKKLEQRRSQEVELTKLNIVS
jgi:hypothetical protein